MSDKIAALLEQRGSSWGNAASMHSRIAQVWSGILDTEVTAGQVALCMAGLELVRASVNPDDPDSFDDGHGYLTIAEDIYGHNNLPHESRPDIPLLREACFNASCSTEQNRLHGTECTNTCKCGLGTK